MTAALKLFLIYVNTILYHYYTLYCTQCNILIIRLFIHIYQSIILFYFTNVQPLSFFLIFVTKNSPFLLKMQFFLTTVTVWNMPSCPYLELLSIPLPPLQKIPRPDEAQHKTQAVSKSSPSLLTYHTYPVVCLQPSGSPYRPLLT